MFPSKTRHWVLLCVLGLGGLAIALAVVAWQGYLFPLRYYEYFPNGRVSVEGYKLRRTQHSWLNEGKWTFYSSDKDDRKGYEGYFHKGVQVGTWTRWNPDGSIKEIEERDTLGVKTRTAYENGVPKVVWDRDKEPRHYWSATIFDDDPAKDTEIQKAIDLKVQHGATPQEAEDAVVKELKLPKQAAKQSSAMTLDPAPSR